VIPIEINRELKDPGNIKEGSYRNIASKHSLAFINALESTNKLVVLHHLTPLPILGKGATLRE